MEGPIWFVALFAGGFCVAGTGLVVVGLVWFSRTGRFVAGAKEADGVVVDRKDSDNPEDTGVRPVVSFETQDGGTVTFVEPISGFPPRIGRRVLVLYDPRDPRRARMRTFAKLWLFPTLLVTLGAFFLVMVLLSAAIGVFLFSAMDLR